MGKNFNPQGALEYIQSTFLESIDSKTTFVNTHTEQLLACAKVLSECLKRGGKILVAGNGGSAADAQHFAAEMTGRMLVERNPLAAIALTTDTSALTAIGNDYGYDFVFERQLRALARAGDVFIAISTSGNSKNIILAAQAAKDLGCQVLALTGGSGGKLADLTPLCLNVSAAKNACRTQETHIFIIHTLIDLIDRFY